MWYRLHRLAAAALAVAAISLVAMPTARSADAPVGESPPLAAAQRLRLTGDTGGRPFAIVDKQRALLSVFHADGRLAGTTRALLGRDVGDDSVPGVGDRAQSGGLRAGDRTTPAGRFDTVPGRNTQGEPVVWVDYAAAFAIHRVRPGPLLDDRLRRLATADPGDNRVSAGCVVVPEAFYLTVVQPVLGQGRGTVYVLPEQGGWDALWRDLARRSL